MQDPKLQKLSYKSHYWRYVNAFIGAIAGVVGLIYVFFGDTDKTARVWSNIQASFEQSAIATTPTTAASSPAASPLVTLTASAAEYHVGDRFDYRFSTTHDGYVSLWNITATGRVQRIFPMATNRRAQRVIAGQAYASGRDGPPSLIVSGTMGVEQLLLLWCPQRDGQGFSGLFPRTEAFERDLRKRHANGCIAARTSYRILPDSSR